jgi:hypothetical protein
VELGVRRFRIDLLEHDARATGDLIRGYREALAGRRDGQELWRELKASATFGVTRGPLGRADA